MKIASTIIKIVTALAAVAGVVYLIATYGDKIVAWAKKLLGKCCCDCECEDCECNENGECCCDCECDTCECCDCECDEEPAEEAAEEPAEEPAESEANDADFEG